MKEDLKTFKKKKSRLSRKKTTSSQEKKMMRWCFDLSPHQVEFPTASRRRKYLCIVFSMHRYLNRPSPTPFVGPVPLGTCPTTLLYQKTMGFSY